MDQLYSYRSAAKKLDISVTTLRRCIKKYNIERYKVSKRYRIKESDLKKLVKVVETETNYSEGMLARRIYGNYKKSIN
jgi:excisionase family DNA binding protein